MFTIYIHKNKTNNKLYIGQTCQNPKKRWANGNHYENNKYFSNAIKKYGWDNFEHIIYATNLTQEQSNEMEKYLIEKFKTNNKNFGYNIRSGGNNGRLSEETKQKISAKNKGKNHPMYGKRHSIETIQKMKMNNNHHSNNPTKRAKPIFCVELSKIFPSAFSAGKELNINVSHITQCCKGNRKTCGKYHWQYA